MLKVKLEAAARELGKKGSRAARREDLIPCVLYAKGTEPKYFTAPLLNLRPLIYTNQLTVGVVELDGTTYECIIKEIDFHPTNDKPIHIDFLALLPGQKIRTSVPLHTTGTPIGVQKGGALKKVIFKVNVECTPDALPEFIPVDVSGLEIGKDIRVRDLSMDGIRFLSDASQAIAKVVVKRVR